MEDILASIRRIIADDHSRTVAAASNAYRRSATQNVAQSAPLRFEPEEPEPVEADATLPGGTQDGTDAAETAVAELPDWSRAPAEEAAAATRAFAQPPISPPPIPAAIESELSVIAEIVNAGAAAILEPPSTTAPSATSVRLADAAPAGLDPAPPQEQPSQPEPDAEEPVLSLHGFEAVFEVEQPAAAPSTSLSVEPLLSASVGASVESSLQTLATSVFMQNAATVESMTREMLRPLLKTWLDDNLPTIVERLVRIEIERVARGVRG